jgi:hypothetical protein
VLDGRFWRCRYFGGRGNRGDTGLKVLGLGEGRFGGVGAGGGDGVEAGNKMLRRCWYGGEQRGMGNGGNQRVRRIELAADLQWLT